jgi:hypothetical protein
MDAFKLAKRLVARQTLVGFTDKNQSCLIARRAA